MQIRKCQSDEDIQQLAKLANEIWHEYFIDIISFEQIEYMVEKFQSYPALKKAIEEEQYTYFLAFEETELIGYLSKLYLRKDKRGQGLASYLLEEAIKFAKEQNKQAIYLTCNKYNQHSLDVYHGKGFQDINAVQTDIGRGFIMDDYILEKVLS